MQYNNNAGVLPSYIQRHIISFEGIFQKSTITRL